MHAQNYKSGTVEENTSAYLNAMRHPCVKVLGHCDNPAFPVDYETLAFGAKEYGVIFEINEASLMPDGYRGDTPVSYTHLDVYKRQVPVIPERTCFTISSIFTLFISILNFPPD